MATVQLSVWKPSQLMVLDMTYSNKQVFLPLSPSLGVVPVSCSFPIALFDGAGACYTPLSVRRIEAKNSYGVRRLSPMPENNQCAPRHVQSKDI